VSISSGRSSESVFDWEVEESLCLSVDAIVSLSFGGGSDWSSLEGDVELLSLGSNTESLSLGDGRESASLLVGTESSVCDGLLSVLVTASFSASLEGGRE